MTRGGSPDGTRARVRRWARRETSAGLLLLGSALVAITLANSPARAGYLALTRVEFGPAVLGLRLSLAQWAADGLLTVFFFVVGVELKHEFVHGGLRRPSQAGVPILAALGGVVVPSVMFVLIVLASGDPGAVRGWAIPSATDIAFALAVLAIFGRGLPRELRTFLLTLAVVDDLLGIGVIAVFHTERIAWPTLAASMAVVGVFAALVRARRPRWWFLLPVALAAWALTHASGVHATIAGVALGLVIPAPRFAGETMPRTEAFERDARPFASGVSLPVFAFFSAGVPLFEGGRADAVVSQPVFWAIACALFVGKALGVLSITWLVTRLTPLRLPNAIGMRDLLGVGSLTGMGFTVSLLLAELSFPHDERQAAAKAAIIAGSLASAILAAITLARDARTARHADMNEDGAPDEFTGLIGDEDDA